MSYHVHNLEPGDVISGPEDLFAYYEFDSYDDDEPFLHWRVVKVEKAGTYTSRVFLREVGKPWHQQRTLLNDDTSLCMVEDNSEPFLDRFKNGFTKQMPQWVRQILWPRTRPGAAALDKAVFYTTPLGQLTRALEQGTFHVIESGSSLQVEDLSPVLSNSSNSATERST